MAASGHCSLLGEGKLNQKALSVTSGETNPGQSGLLPATSAAWFSGMGEQWQAALNEDLHELNTVTAWHSQKSVCCHFTWSLLDTVPNGQPLEAMPKAEEFEQEADQHGMDQAWKGSHLCEQSQAATER